MLKKKNWNWLFKRFSKYLCKNVRFEKIDGPLSFHIRVGSILFATFFGIGHFFLDISLRITKICFEKFGLRIVKENLGIETALILVFNHQNDVILVRMLRKAFGGELVTEYFNKEIKGLLVHSILDLVQIHMQ